jgi:hypothetical protein
MFFASDRPGGFGLSNIYVTIRKGALAMIKGNRVIRREATYWRSTQNRYVEVLDHPHVGLVFRRRLGTAPWFVAGLRLSRVQVETELTTQPGFRDAPFSLGGRWRYVKNARGFFDRQTAEGAQFHDSGQRSIELGQLLEGQVESQDRYPVGRRCVARLLNRHRGYTVTALSGVMPTGVIDQYAVHHFRGCAKEVSAGLPVDVPLFNHSQVSLVNQRGRLQCMACTFASQLTARDLSQLRIDKWQQLTEGGGIAAAPVTEKRCDAGSRWHDAPQTTG